MKLAARKNQAFNSVVMELLYQIILFSGPRQLHRPLLTDGLGHPTKASVVS
jgi:hypothetical protein